MKFNLSEPQPTLADVKINQFFVTTDDKLCQKVTASSYNIIAHLTANNDPLLNNSALMASCTQPAQASMPIKRVCPHVHSIDF